MVPCLSQFRNRKEIAKYKTAAMAQKFEGEELLVVSPPGDESSSKPSVDSPLQGNKTSPSNGEVSDLKEGTILVTWKDGNTSHLFSDPAADEDKQEGASAAEAVNMME